MLTKLISAGMNCARMNFSHGTHEFHQRTIDNLRASLSAAAASASTSFDVSAATTSIALMLDTKGPEIRTGHLVTDPIILESGKQFLFECDPNVYSSFKGDSNGVSVSYARMCEVVWEGATIMVDDGLLSFKVIRVEGTKIITVIENGGELSETKGVNLPGIHVDLPALTDKDKSDIAFGIRNGVDMVAASFIRRAEDVEEIRSFIQDTMRNLLANKTDCYYTRNADTYCVPLIISKIENHQGLDNFDSILASSDGIMVARGDLGVEIPVEQVCRAQKWMLAHCNKAGKPSITATQMLESMMHNPRPTRAEATDVANAVLDGSDSVMLSGETAKGAYPIRAVDMMARVCRVAEQDVNYANLYADLRRHILPHLPLTTHEAIASAAVKSAWETQAACIIALTETGRMGKAFARFRPIPPVLAITASPTAARQMCILRVSIHW